MNKKNCIMIMGCGRLGSGIAGRLSDKGNDVIVIDSDKSSFRKLPSSYGGLIMVSEATDISRLLTCQINNVDTLIAVTNDDNANICAAQIGREIFKIPRVIARIYDDEKSVLLKPLGIDIICPAALSEKEISNFINWGDKKDD